MYEQCVSCYGVILQKLGLIEQESEAHQVDGVAIPLFTRLICLSQFVADVLSGGRYRPDRATFIAALPNSCLGTST